MKQKLKSVVAFVLAVAMVFSSVMLDFTPAKAATSGIVEGENITANKSMEYCWAGDDITLSVVAVAGTKVTWKVENETTGITLDDSLKDTEKSNGVQKNCKVAFADNAQGTYTISVTDGVVTRTCNLVVRNKLSDIQGDVITNFEQQYTDTDFIVKVVVKASEARKLTWSVDKPEFATISETTERKDDTTTYPGSVVKYAKVTLGKNKPDNGTVRVTAKVAEEESTVDIKVLKSAEAMKDIAVTASSNKEVDLEQYSHLDKDNLYVDVNEEITITGEVDRTLMGVEGFEDDTLVSVQNNSGEYFSIGNMKYMPLEDKNSYKFAFSVTGTKATNTPYELTILTASGKFSKTFKVNVLCEATEVGITTKENANVDLTNFNALYEKEYVADAQSFVLKKKADTNVANYNNASRKNYPFTYQFNNYGTTLVKGKSVELVCHFLGRFQLNDSQTGYDWKCHSTDTVEWSSLDETIATVDSTGKVTGKKEGNTVITAKAKATKTSPRADVYATYNIYVRDITSAESIEIQRDSQPKVVDEIYTTQKETGVQYAVEIGNSNEDIFWTSTDEKVFTVDQNGLVKPVAAGTATLIASTASTGKRAYVTITVIAPVEKITLNYGATTSGIKGHFYEYIASINAEADANELLTWSVSDNSILALVDPSDANKKELSEFTGKKVLVKVKSETGAATVSVRGQYLASAIANTRVECISAIPADSVKITNEDSGEDYTNKEIEAYYGKNIILKANLFSDSKLKSNDDYVWEIEQDEKVPVVQYDSTKLLNNETLTLTPLTKGDVKINLRSLNTNALATVTIHLKVAATEFSLANKENEWEAIYMVPNTKHQLTAVVYPTNTSDVVEFTSSNPEIATVDQNGLITALKESAEPVTITAKVNDVLSPITCKVIVQIPLDKLVVQETKENSGNTGRQVTDGGYINVYLNSYKTIAILKDKNANEEVEWYLENGENIATIKVVENSGTHELRINGKANGNDVLHVITKAKHEDNSRLEARITINVVNKLTGLEEFTVPEKLGYNAYNNSVVARVKQNADDVVFSTSDESIATIVTRKDSNSGTYFYGDITVLKTGKVTIFAKTVDGTTLAAKEVAVEAASLPYPVLNVDRFDYNGKTQKPTVTVKNGEKVLKAGTDYTVSIPNSVNAGTYTVKVTGKGNYTGTYELVYYINARDLSKVSLSSAVKSATYTGKEIKPAVTVKDFGGTKKLVPGKDVTVSYSNNILVGTARVEIYSNSVNYTGSKAVEFKITPASLSKVKFEKVADLVYNGNAQEPILNATFNKNPVNLNYDFTMKCTSNKNPGKMKISIKGINNFTGSKTIYCYIKPAMVDEFYVDNSKAKTMKMTWKKDKTVSGYEIYYSTKDNFAKKYRKSVSITKYKTVSKTVKSLKTGKTYYVKIRSYKKVGSKKVYSDWSNVSTVTIQ